MDAARTGASTSRGRDWNAVIVFLLGLALSVWIGVRHSSVTGALVMLLIGVVAAVSVHVLRKRHRERNRDHQR